MNLRTYISRTVVAATTLATATLGLSACGGEPSYDWLKTIDPEFTVEEIAKQGCDLHYYGTERTKNGVEQTLGDAYLKEHPRASAEKVAQVVDEFLTELCPTVRTPSDT